MRSVLLDFTKNNQGATALEYALIGALVSIAIVSAMIGIGSGVESQFQQVNTSFGQAQ